MFVDRCLFIQGSFLCNHIRYQARVLAVFVHIAPDIDTVAAKLLGHLDGHGGVHTIFTGLVAAGRHNTPVRHPAYDHRLTIQPAVKQPFHRNEEGVKVEMCDSTIQDD